MGAVFVGSLLVGLFAAVIMLLPMREITNKFSRDKCARRGFKTYPHTLRDGTVLMYSVRNVDAVDL